jgi:hypothetical protein
MTPRFPHAFAIALAAAGAAAALTAAPVRAQGTPTVVTPALDFSGVVFGSWGIRTDSAARATLGGKSPNQFSLDRAYLTVRMPAGDNAAIRVTTDVFQQTNSTSGAYYGGWVMRIKYGYVQYTALRGALGAGSNLTGRIGVLHTVVIDHQEAFWPRYLSQVALERNGFMSSADAGLAGLLTLGDKWGELYATVVNGSGYAAVERDRFKDFAVRLSLTPLANHQSMSPIWKSLAVTPWYSKGWNPSAFAAGGTNQVGPGENGAVTDGLRKDRYGIFAGVKDRRVTAGVEWAQRNDAGDGPTNGNTQAVPRVVTDSTGRLVDGFLLLRPFELLDPARPSGLQLVGRYDRYTPNTSPASATYGGSTPSYDYWVLGASYDLTQRFTMALDWQVQKPVGFPAPGGTTVRAVPRSSSLFLHWQANF